MTERDPLERCEATRGGKAVTCWCRRELGHDGDHRCSCGVEWTPRPHPSQHRDA